MRALAAIKRSGLDLVVWHRRPPPGLEDWLKSVSIAPTLRLDLKGVTAESAELPRRLPDAFGQPCRELVEDVQGLLEGYQALVGAQPLRVQLALSDHQHCPKFHVDFVGLRLLCTYSGAGTEWIPEPALDRSAIALCPVGRAPLRPGGQVQQVAPLDVAIFKGSAWPGNRSRGVVHRSPPADGRPRLVLTVDTLKPPAS